VDRESRIAEIAEAGRRTRKAAPRGMWIAAVVIGGLCAIGFAIAMLAGGEPGPRVARHASVGSSSHAGVGTLTISPPLGVGLVVGLVAGVVIGIAIGRQRSAARDHSSRKRP
jgi:hypothetical protein